MKLCDLHSDTPYELYTRRIHLNDNQTDITIDSIGMFERYLQLSAVCPRRKDSNSDGWDLFFGAKKYFEEELSRFSFILASSGKEAENTVSENIPTFIMTVEDARILDGDISRLNLLYSEGVRVITPLWGGNTVIGGSHDTNEGLTEFGREVMRACASLGIITDISHASEKSADDILNIAVGYGMPVIASHSCSYSVYPNSRNIRDVHMTEVIKSGGIVGCSLFPYHICGKRFCNTADAEKHMKYFGKYCPNRTALGCDYDGMDDIKVYGLEKQSDLVKLYSSLGEEADDIFFNTAYDFLINNISD